MVAQTFSSSTWEAEAGHSLVVRSQLSLQSKFRTVRAVTQRSPVSKNSSSKGKPGRIWALSKESSKLVIFYPFFSHTAHRVDCEKPRKEGEVGTPLSQLQRVFPVHTSHGG